MEWQDLERICDECDKPNKLTIDIGGYEGGDFICIDCLKALLEKAGFAVVSVEDVE